MFKILCPIQKAAHHNPHHIALIEGNNSLTYEELDRKIQNTCLYFQKLGVKRSQRIAIVSSNSSAYIIALWALMRIKAVAVLINTRNPKETMVKQLKNLNCRLVLFPDKKLPIKNIRQTDLNKIQETNEHPMEPHGQSSRPLLNTLLRQNAFAFGFVGLSAKQAPWALPPRRTSAEAEPFSDSSTGKARGLLRRRIKQKCVFDLKQEATILYTSGTSAEPKAALHTFGNHYYSALGSNDHIAFGKNDRWLLSLPLYHVGGLSILFRVFVAEGTVVILNNQKNIVREIKQNCVTHVSLVSTQFIRLAKPSNIKILKKLKCILLGGSAMPEYLLIFSKANHLTTYISYGLTEMSSQVATSLKSKFEKVKILKYRRLKISKDKEILVKGQTLFKGYIHQNKIIRPTDKKGWFHTGDLGELHHNNLRVIGRRDNMFISGGENIQPEEVEKILLQINGVQSAIVVPQEDREFGQRPVAFIKSNRALNLNRLNKILARTLPRYKIPVRFYPWPKTDGRQIKLPRQYFKNRI